MNTLALLINQMGLTPAEAAQADGHRLCHRVAAL